MEDRLAPALAMVEASIPHRCRVAIGMRQSRLRQRIPVFRPLPVVHQTPRIWDPAALGGSHTIPSDFTTVLGLNRIGQRVVSRYGLVVFAVRHDAQGPAFRKVRNGAAILSVAPVCLKFFRKESAIFTRQLKCFFHMKYISCLFLIAKKPKSSLD